MWGDVAMKTHDRENFQVYSMSHSQEKIVAHMWFKLLLRRERGEEGREGGREQGRNVSLLVEKNWF